MDSMADSASIMGRHDSHNPSDTSCQTLLSLFKVIRTLNEKSKLLHDINRRFERLFFNIDYKTLTADEIVDQYFNLKAEAENVCFFGDDMNCIPQKSDIEYANQETAAYLRSNYNV